MKKKIMLIDPPGFNGLAVGRVYGSFGTNKADQVWPPYDLQILAGYCDKYNHEYKIIDANNLQMSFDEIKKEINEYQPDWVIYMTSFPTFILDSKIALISKEVNKHIKTACISLSMFSIENPSEQLEKLTNLDYIIWGEPEVPLMKLINGNNPKEIKGLYYKDKAGHVKFSGFTKKLDNLDELGIPRHSCISYKMYKCPLALRLPMTVVACSRGCVNRCVHCQAGSFQRPIRYRSVENVLKELDEIKSLGIKEIKFWDCSLPSNQKFVEKLCNEIIKKKYSFSWHCNARAEFINEDILKIMKRAGCHTIAIGCESADDKILYNMGKRETSDEIRRAILLIKKMGMRVLMYVTYGLEGETEDTMKKTYNFIEKLNPEFATFGIVVPAPCTPFYYSLKKKGYLINKRLEFRDPNALPSFKYPHLDSKKILEYSRYCYRKYYFRPRYIIGRLRRLKSFTELKMSLTNAIRIIKRSCFEKVI